MQRFKPAPTLLAACLFAVMALVVLLGQYTPIVSARGFVVPDSGYVTLSSDRGGMVTRLMVNVGDQVSPGTPLVELSPKRLTSRNTNVDDEMIVLLQQIKATQQQRLSDLHEQSVQQKSSLVLQIELIATQLSATALALTQSKHQVTQLRESVKKYELLNKDFYVSTEMLENKRYALFNMESRTLDTARAAKQLEIQQAALQEKITLIDTDEKRLTQTILFDLNKTDQQLLQANFNKSNLITSDIQGTVSAISFKDRQSIQPGEILFQITPANSTLSIQLNVPSKAVAKITRGQTVNLKYLAFPYIRYGIYTGIVTQVSEVPLNYSATDRQQLDRPARTGSYSVFLAPDKQTIRVDGQQVPIVPGSEVEAEIQLAPQRVIDWVLAARL